VLLGDCGDGFIFQINEFRDQLQRVLGACRDAFSAAVAFVRVDYDEVFA
jgi:hypothetical protein